jgi:ABC-type oligopeptide transport system substrate-binding subunit
VDGIKAADLPETGLNYFMINTKKSPTDDAHIRKALSYACNYEQMKQVMSGWLRSGETKRGVPLNVF